MQAIKQIKNHTTLNISQLHQNKYALITIKLLSVNAFIAGYRIF